MKTIFIRSNKHIYELGNKIRILLNVNSSNRSPYQKEQTRYGDNYGGEYFVMELLGMELFIISNSGENKYFEYSDWPFFLIIRAKNKLLKDFEKIILKIIFENLNMDSELQLNFVDD